MPHSSVDDQPPTPNGWQVANFEKIPPLPCPCGQSSRAFMDCSAAPASVHRVEINQEARTHYHKRLTEYYYILECEANAAVELDGKSVAVQVGDCLLIPPGTRHRALGCMTLLNLVIPKFDPTDEWFD